MHRFPFLLDSSKPILALPIYFYFVFMSLSKTAEQITVNSDILRAFVEVLETITLKDKVSIDSFISVDFFRWVLAESFRDERRVQSLINQEEGTRRGDKRVGYLS